MSDKQALILGHGYTAKYLAPQFRKNKVVSTSRKGPPFLPFDLMDESTWDSLPEKVDLTFWTFPALPLEKVKRFYELNCNRLGQLIVIGSTSAFVTSQPDQRVDESTPLDLSQERVQGEEFLRSQGAISVYSAGIYGPDRNPLDWVKKAYVGKSSKYVNMIHVKDLCQFLIKASEVGKPGSLYIATDGNPQRWQDVIEIWEQKGLVKDVPLKESMRASKKIDNSQSISELKIDLEFENFENLIL